MTLLWIVLATTAGGVASVAVAASLSLTMLRPVTGRLLAFAVGILLAVALTDLIPEAVDALGIEGVGATLLMGMSGFFLLEKATLWRHEHGHHAAEADSIPGHDPAPAGLHAMPQPALNRSAGLGVLIGDGVHNFVDGLLIAAAFLQDPALGFATAVAVVAHEIPQEIGDFAVLLECGFTRRRALWFNAASGLASIVGGVLGYFSLQALADAVPYALAVSAAGFLYVALADLVPVLQRHSNSGDVAGQVLLIAAGIALGVSVH